MRQHYREGMEDQFGALGLALNCVVPFNSLYIDAAAKQLRAWVSNGKRSQSCDYRSLSFHRCVGKS
ncbi:Tn3 family transposase [Streptomyces sp. NPDC058067]|uniref:Tn3 family transposase n=1 Tax=Streptomyces sp. NPDC058067 TaxID=3346324 RepID=UPI0036E5E23A